VTSWYNISMSALFLTTYGFFCLISQVVIMRELAALFAGQEVFLGFGLAAWLLWVSLGSWLYGRLRTRRFFSEADQRELVATAAAAAALAVVAAVILIRMSRGLMPFGQLPGPAVMFAGCLCLLAFPCVAAGFLFALAGAHFFSAKGRAWGYLPYALETAGALCGGLAYTFYGAGRFSPLELVFAGGLALIAVSWVYVRSALRNSSRLPWVFYALVLVYIIASVGGERLGAWSRAAGWPGFSVAAHYSSCYSDLVVLRRANAHTLVQNGAVIAQYPAAAADAESLHWALLVHPAPRTVLIAGAGMQGIAGLAAYPTLDRAVFAEQDAALVDLYTGLLGPADFQVAGSAWFDVAFDDVRSLLAHTRAGFDAIALRFPEPVTLAHNRYYTKEFFAAVNRALTPGGVCSVTMPGAENYLTPAMRERLAAIIAAMRLSFPHLLLVPGDPVTVLVSGAPLPGEEVMRARLMNLQPPLESLTPHELSRRLQDASRQQMLDSAVIGHRANTDRDPSAYRSSLRVWLSAFITPGGLLLLCAAAVIGWVVVRRWSVGLRALCVRRRYAIFWVSGSAMAAELLLLLLFQSTIGTLYYHLGILFAVFMAGVAAGSLAARPGERLQQESLARAIRWTQYTCAAFLVGLAAFSSALAGLTRLQAWVFFITALMVAGLFVGGVYTLCSFMVPADEPPAEALPRLYAADLIGAAVGLTAVSLILLPFFSLPAILMVAGAVVAGAALLER